MPSTISIKRMCRIFKKGLCPDGRHSLAKSPQIPCRLANDELYGRTRARHERWSRSALDRFRVQYEVSFVLLCMERVSREKQLRSHVRTSPQRNPSGASVTGVGYSRASLHQSLEDGASFGDLWQSRVRSFEVREKFLVLIDGLVAFPGVLIDLAEIVVGEDLDCREAQPYEC
jgi:hypothetical protein